MGLCLENAHTLIEDAKLLYRNRRYARAVALATLSIEELGKLPMFASASLIGGEKDLWKRFWRRFRSHVRKRFNVSGIDLHWLRNPTWEKIIQESNAEWKAEARVEMMKQLCLYVDAIQGRFVSPSEFFRGGMGAKVVKQYITIAQNTYTRFATTHKRAKPSRFVRQGRKLKRKGIADSIMIKPDKFLEYVNGFSRGTLRKLQQT